MSFDTNWDIDKYKEEHESDDHWLLRRNFMEKWKPSFPEDRLVCLARVFANTEFMGCRYPTEVMQEVAMMSKEVNKILTYNNDSDVNQLHSRDDDGRETNNEDDAGCSWHRFPGEDCWDTDKSGAPVSSDVSHDRMLTEHDPSAVDHKDSQSSLSLSKPSNFLKSSEPVKISQNLTSEYKLASVDNSTCTKYSENNLQYIPSLFKTDKQIYSPSFIKEKLTNIHMSEEEHIRTHRLPNEVNECTSGVDRPVSFYSGCVTTLNEKDNNNKVLYPKETTYNVKIKNGLRIASEVKKIIYQNSLKNVEVFTVNRCGNMCKEKLSEENKHKALWWIHQGIRVEDALILCLQPYQEIHKDILEGKHSKLQISVKNLVEQINKTNITVPRTEHLTYSNNFDETTITQTEQNVWDNAQLSSAQAVNTQYKNSVVTAQDQTISNNYNININNQCIDISDGQQTESTHLNHNPICGNLENPQMCQSLAYEVNTEKKSSEKYINVHENNNFMLSAKNDTVTQKDLKNQEGPEQPFKKISFGQGFTPVTINTRKVIRDENGAKLKGLTKMKYRYWIFVGKTPEEAQTLCHQRIKAVPEYKLIKTQIGSLKSFKSGKLQAKYKSVSVSNTKLFRQCIKLLENSETTDKAKLHNQKPLPKENHPDPNTSETPLHDKKTTSDDKDDTEAAKISANSEKLVTPSNTLGKQKYKQISDDLKNKTLKYLDSQKTQMRLAEKIVGSNTNFTPLKVLIRDPNRNITYKECEEVQNAILQCMDDDEEIYFVKCEPKQGCAVVTCADECARDWLDKQVPTLQPWDGAQLEIVVHNRLPPKNPRTPARFHIPVVPECSSLLRLKSQDILKNLHQQNPKVGCDKWIIMNIQITSDGILVMAHFEDNSIKFLQSSGFRLKWYSAMPIKVKLVGKKFRETQKAAFAGGQGKKKYGNQKPVKAAGKGKKKARSKKVKNAAGGKYGSHESINPGKGGKSQMLHNDWMFQSQNLNNASRIWCSRSIESKEPSGFQMFSTGYGTHSGQVTTTNPSSKFVGNQEIMPHARSLANMSQQVEHSDWQSGGRQPFTGPAEGMYASSRSCETRLYPGGDGHLQDFQNKNFSTWETNTHLSRKQGYRNEYESVYSYHPDVNAGYSRATTATYGIQVKDNCKKWATESTHGLDGRASKWGKNLPSLLPAHKAAMGLAPQCPQANTTRLAVEQTNDLTTRASNNTIGTNKTSGLFNTNRVNYYSHTEEDRETMKLRRKDVYHVRMDQRRSDFKWEAHPTRGNPMYDHYRPSLSGMSDDESDYI